MNFLIFIFSYIDIQPEYNLLSFILSAHSKLNIGAVKHHQHFYPCENIREPVSSSWMDDWFGQNCLVIVPPGLASSIAAPQCLFCMKGQFLPELQVGYLTC